MASNIKISEAMRNAGAEAMAALMDGGTGNGYVKFFSGAPPANPAAADTGTLLGTCVGSNPFFIGPATNGVLSSDAISPETSAPGSADVGHFRGYDGDDVCHFQGTAGEAADTPDIEFDEKTIVATGVINITSLSISVPE